MKHYQVDYNRYSFKAEDDWGERNHKYKGYSWYYKDET